MICSRRKEKGRTKKTATTTSHPAAAAPIMLKKHFVSLLLDEVTVSLSWAVFLHFSVIVGDIYYAGWILSQKIHTDFNGAIEKRLSKTEIPFDFFLLNEDDSFSFRLFNFFSATIQVTTTAAILRAINELSDGKKNHENTQKMNMAPW